MTALPIDSTHPATAAGDAAGAPHLVVVAPRGRARLLWTVAALVVLATAVLAAVTLNAVAADDAVSADRLEDRLRAAEIVHGQLVTDVAALESPSRIADAAAELGLVRVDNPRQLRVRRLLPADGLVHDDIHLLPQD